MLCVHEDARLAHAMQNFISREMQQNWPIALCWRL